MAQLVVIDEILAGWPDRCCCFPRRIHGQRERQNFVSVTVRDNLQTVGIGAGCEQQIPWARCPKRPRDDIRSDIGFLQVMPLPSLQAPDHAGQIEFSLSRASWRAYKQSEAKSDSRRPWYALGSFARKGIKGRSRV
jgi:hypothetical protein